MAEWLQASLLVGNTGCCIEILVIATNFVWSDS